ncbi:MAG: efflux RND transporter permease subunit [Pontibacterium sp.]
MQTRLFEWVLKRPLLVTLVSLVLIMGMAAGGQNLVFKSDYRVYFSEDNPQLTAFEDMQKIYNKSDNVAFVLSPKNKNVFTPVNLQAISWLTHESWQIPYSNRVDSITNYQYTWAEEDDMIVEDLVLDAESVDQTEADRVRDIALAEPLLVPRLVSELGHVAIVNVTIQLPGIDPVTEVPEVVTKVRALQGELMAQYPDMDVRLSGIVMMNNAFAEASLDDNATLVPLMFLIVLVAMIFLLRTFSGTFATLMVIIGTILGTMGSAGWAGFFLSGPSATAPTMILTLAVADSVHILASMFYEMRHGATKKQAILTSLRVNFQPILLTSVTTAIGFLSMNFSDSPPFRDLGNMVAFGVMIAFVLSVTLLPALLMLLPVKVKPVEEGKQDLMGRLSSFVITQRARLLPAMALIMVVMISFLPKNELNDDFVQYFDTSVPFREATDYMADNVSGIGSMEISIDSGQSSGINDPKFLAMLGELTDWLLLQPEVDHVNTISDTLKRLNKNMHADDQSYYRLPEDRELSAQYLLLYEMSLPYGLDLNNQLNVDKSGTRVVATVKNLTSNELIVLEERIYDWFSRAGVADDYQITVASPNLMFAHIGQRNIESMLMGTAMALLLISFLLGVALRSVKFGLISLIPNLAPAAMGFGLWYLIDGEIGLALSVVAGMTIGIVVDDTVHFLSKYLHARREKGYSAEQAVSYSFNNVGRALWITTLVLVAGFMVLAQSTFKLNADMGLLTALTILIALIVDFLFLPPLLMLLDKTEESKQVKAQEA